MCNTSMLNEITSKITNSAKKVLGKKLHDVILYGSYARGDYNEDSDIDIMVLADVPDEEAFRARNRIKDVAGDLDLEYDIIVSVKLNNKKLFEERSAFVPFYQNVIRDGVKLYGN